MTSAAELSSSGKPEAMTDVANILGTPAGGVKRSALATVPWLTGEPPAATVPLRTLVKNNSVMGPALTEVMSHGPLMAPPEKVSTTCPELLSTRRQPDPAMVLPSLVGRLPTTTQPPGRIDKAVVRPTPPGQEPGRWLGSIWAKTWGEAPGAVVGLSSTIVVPRPCRPDGPGPLLKLLTSTSPATSAPWLLATTATPYGLTSPFGGMVEPISDTVE